MGKTKRGEGGLGYCASAPYIYARKRLDESPQRAEAERLLVVSQIKRRCRRAQV